jgi:putative endonuclease
MYFVYILLRSDKKLYTGFTDNLDRRYTEHNLGKVFSTKPYRPLELVHYEAYLEKTDAVRREKFLKSTEGKKLLRKQIRDILLAKHIIE